MQYKCMACNAKCLMCSMKCTDAVPMDFQVQVQCIMYTVQCAGCSVLPAKDRNSLVEAG